jgi:hypothetical protein
MLSPDVFSFSQTDVFQETSLRQDSVCIHWLTYSTISATCLAHHRHLSSTNRRSVKVKKILIKRNMAVSLPSFDTSFHEHFRFKYLQLIEPKLVLNVFHRPLSGRTLWNTVLRKLVLLPSSGRGMKTSLFASYQPKYYSEQFNGSVRASFPYVPDDGSRTNFRNVTKIEPMGNGQHTC